MRLNPTRAAVISVVSASAIIGLPITVAAPAGAQPLGAWDNDGPDAVELPVLPHAGEDSAPPPSAKDLADPVPDAVSPAADTATEAALPGILDVTADEAQSQPESSAPAPEAPQSPGGSDTGDTNSGDVGSGDTTNSGDPSSSGDATSAGDSTSSGDTTNSGDSTGQNSDENAEPMASDAAAVQTKATTETGEGSGAGASATRSEPLAATGAASGDVARTGLALLFAGAVLVGAGRHRRPGRARILI